MESNTLEMELNRYTKAELIDIIMDPNFDDHGANLIKIWLIEQYTKEIEQLAIIPAEATIPEAVNSPTNNFSREDLFYINYCYYTSIGKEATDARKAFRKKLISKVALSKWDERCFLFEADAGQSYSRWCVLWAKEIEKNFQIHFGKDISKWLPRIKQRFEEDRLRAEKDRFI